MLEVEAGDEWRDGWKRRPEKIIRRDGRKRQSEKIVRRDVPRKMKMKMKGVILSF